MAKYPNITITQAGLNMIAANTSDKKIIYTKIGIGDGSLAENEDITKLADMKNKIISADIGDIESDGNGQFTLTTTISNKVVTTGFFAREIGIYAKFDSEQEILYGYANAGTNADYLPDNSQPVDELKLKITLIVGNVSNVTAVINSSIIFITLEDCRREISRHNTDAGAHADIRNNYVKKTGDVMTGDLTVPALHASKLNTTSVSGWYNETFDGGWYMQDSTFIRAYSNKNVYTGGKMQADSGFEGNLHGTADYATKDRLMRDIPDTYFPKSGGTINGNITASGSITASTIYSNNWFRSYGDNGWFNETHGGGWYMSDDTWIRTWNNKSVWTPQKMQADNGFYGNLHGTADTATNAVYVDNDNAHMRFHWSGKDGQPTWLWGSPNDGANSYVYNPSNFHVAYADNAGTVNGWNVDTIKRNLGGRNQPTLTSILDGCYDGNGNKINKLVNAGKGISGYGTGDIHLTQSYKNFDKILVVLSNDDTNYTTYTLWDTWHLAYAFSHGWRVALQNAAGNNYWEVWTAVNSGTETHPLSTDTVWYLCNENSVLTDIIGVNY